jgi:hypothetical protein
MTDEQRSQTGWIGVPKWEVILGWALSFHPLPSEDVVAPSDTHLESEIVQQSTKKSPHSCRGVFRLTPPEGVA